MSKPNLLLMSGSLRQASYNKKLLREAVRAFGEAEAVEADLNLPLYDGDLESRGLPPGVVTLMDQVRDTDALLIGAPEYNKGMSGVLKNATDWLSRAKQSVLKDKIAVVMSATGGRTGGEVAHFMTVNNLIQLQVQVVHGPLILVAKAQEEFGEDGRLNNEFLQGQLRDRMARLRAMLA
ncbi:NADPH-dependent oxidoreductase [Roseovarius spongiae]|uniref:NADPH-dependent oxidoreductase n=1 Tax=Roseovarius spongiae TaxID=2320272 RepID=A0A3A8ARM2_9RHOB|nr:NADPH-dependent FMN reductase [Roseovarius spongiae]RKF13505.1 NADPH-dependent oxidoreductase [Roseovarius spongiae]